MAEIRKVIINPDRKLRDDQLKDPYVIQAANIIEVYNICTETQSLPRAGGLLDQDSYYVFLTRHILNCREEKRIIDDLHRSTSSAV